MVLECAEVYIVCDRAVIGLNKRTKAFMVRYSQMLEDGSEGYHTILEHIRDRPTEGLLYHCSGLACICGVGNVVTWFERNNAQLAKTEQGFSLLSG